MQSCVLNDKYENFKYAYEPSQEVCKLGVKQYGCAIKHIKNPHEEVCKSSVKQDGEAIKYIENPSEEVCKLAVQGYGYAIEHIKNPSDDVCELAISVMLNNKTSAKTATQINRDSCHLIFI